MDTCTASSDQRSLRDRLVLCPATAPLHCLRQVCAAKGHMGGPSPKTR